MFGIMEENAHFYVEEKTRHGFLIDPGAQAAKLLKTIEREHYTIEKILLTHGHYDHIGAVNELRAALNVPVCMGRGGLFYAEDPFANGSAFFRQNILLDAVTILEDAAQIILSVDANFMLEVIAAPGHTLDGTIYYSAKDSLAFVGDTIFYGGHGHTDLTGGSEQDLLNTIRRKVFALPDDTILYCGHGKRTTVAAEKTRSFYR